MKVLTKVLINEGNFILHRWQLKVTKIILYYLNIFNILYFTSNSNHHMLHVYKYNILMYS